MDDIFGKEALTDLLPQAWTVESVFGGVRAFHFPQLAVIDSLEMVGFFWFTGPYLDYLYFNAPKVMEEIFSSPVNKEYYESLTVDSPPPWFRREAFWPKLEITEPVYEMISACISHDLFTLTRILNSNTQFVGCTEENLMIWDYSLREEEPIAKRACQRLFEEETQAGYSPHHVQLVENQTTVFSLPPEMIETVQPGDPHYKWSRKLALLEEKDALAEQESRLKYFEDDRDTMTLDTDSLITSDRSHVSEIQKSYMESAARDKTERGEFERRLHISKLENIRDRLRFELRSQLVLNQCDNNDLIERIEENKQVAYFQKQIAQLLKEDKEAEARRAAEKRRIAGMMERVREEKEDGSDSASSDDEQTLTPALPLCKKTLDQGKSLALDDEAREKEEQACEAERGKWEDQEREKELLRQAGDLENQEKKRALQEQNEAREERNKAKDTDDKSCTTSLDMDKITEMMTVQSRAIASLSLHVDSLSKCVEELALKEDNTPLENYLDGMSPLSAELYRRIRKHFLSIPFQGLTTPQCVLSTIEQDYPEEMEDLIHMSPNDFVLGIEARWNTSALRQISNSNNFNREIIELPRVNIMDSLERKLNSIIADHPKLKKLMEQLTTTGAQLNLIHKTNASNIIPDRPGAFGIAPPRQEDEDSLLGYGGGKSQTDAPPREGVSVDKYAKVISKQVIQVLKSSSDDECQEAPLSTGGKGICKIWTDWDESPAAKEDARRSREGGIKSVEVARPKPLHPVEPKTKKVKNTRSLFISSSDDED